MAVDRESVAMRALDLFSGIGGFALAGESLGIETAAFCEIEPFAVNVLQKRFPGVPVFPDVRELGGDSVGGIDIVCGGFPCQDLSVAGKQKGLSGERSGLWFEMLRVISELRPAYVVAENVRGAVNLALDTVYSGLVGEGYKVYPYVIPASAVGAPHQRERLFVVGVREDVAYSASKRLHGGFSEESFECGGENGRYISVEGSGFGLWPTPSVHGNYNRRGLSKSSGDGLATAVKMWPTPHRNCSNGAGAHGDGGLNIQTAVSLWRTPDANCMRGASSDERMKWKREKGMPISINDQVDNSFLNPAWVEILMGFPLGWTDIDCDKPEPWPGWPALMGEDQHPYEPPRTGTGIPHREARLQALGNSVVPAQAYPFFEAIAIMEEVRQCNTASST